MKKSNKWIIFATFLFCAQLPSFSNIFAGFHHPKELDDYLNSTELTNSICSWNLKKSFFEENLGPLMKTLAILPSETTGSTIRTTLTLLGHWALDNEDQETCCNRFSAIKKHIEEIEDPNAKLNLCYWFQKVKDTLLFDVKSQRDAIILVTSNASVKTRDKKGYTLFHQPNLTKELYDLYKKAGLDPEIKDKTGEIPLTHAIRNWYNTQFDIFFRATNIHQRNDEGNIYATEAIKYNNLHALIKILNRGIAINARNLHGYTHLDYALQTTPKDLDNIPKAVSNAANSNKKSALRILRKKIIYALLGQRPENITHASLTKYLQCDSLLYKNFIGASTKEKLDIQYNVWIVQNLLKVNESLKPLILLGSPWQLKYIANKLAQLYFTMVNQNSSTAKKYYGRLFGQHTKDSSAYGTSEAILILFCAEALELGAEENFRHLLALCAQQQLCGPEILDKKYLENSTKKSPLIDALKDPNNQWIFDKKEYLY